MSGRYGGDNRRPGHPGTGPAPGPGSGGDGYGRGPNGPWQPGGQPRQGDPRHQRDQAGGWPQGYDGQGYDGPGYDGPGYDGPGYGNRGYGGQDYPDGGYPGQGYGQPGGQPGGRPGSGASPVYRPRPPASGPQPYPRTGAQPAQRRVPGGTGAQPVPGGRQGQWGPDGGPREPAGYDQRGAGPHRAAEGYGDGYGPAGYGEWESGPADGSFLPGFGRRADRHPGQDGYDEDYGGYDDGRGPDRRPARNRGGRGGDGRGPGAGGPGGGAARRGPASRGRGRDRRDRDRDDRDRDDWDRDDWDRDGGAAPRRRRRSRIRRLAPWIALAVIGIPIVVGGTVGGLYVYHRYEARYHPPDYSGPGTGEVTVQVKSGDTAFSLAPRLVTLGVVASSRAFENAAESSTDTTGLEAGYYKLRYHMKASLAFTALLNPKNRVQTVVPIPEGKRASQVALILAKQTKLPVKDFQRLIKDPAKLGLPSYAKGKVEGYLFPAAYPIEPHETALQILQAMVARFKIEAQQIRIVAAAKSVGLTPAQLIIEASLVQAEGGRVSDYPKIAEVIYNRLKAGMPLKFDSTVFYGLGKYGTRATGAEISTPGPYNTYQNKGLPPTPIDNPGNAAIEGVLHRPAGNLLYFVSEPNGKTIFSATFPIPGT